MAELTPEEKQAMIEAAAAQQSADTELAQAQERSNLEVAAIQAQAAAEENPLKVVPAKMAHAPTRTGGTQGVDEWGPYDDYVLVTTPYGQYGVPKGEIMHFREAQEFSNRARAMITVHLPVYRQAKTGLTRDPITGRYYDPETEPQPVPARV
jgi:hypothetical protein